MKKSPGIATHAKPVKKIRITPILRRVGSCSCSTAIIGITRRYRSVPNPTHAIGTDKRKDLYSAGETATETKLCPCFGVMDTIQYKNVPT